MRLLFNVLITAGWTAMFALPLLGARMMVKDFENQRAQGELQFLRFLSVLARVRALLYARAKSVD
jgi:hypothetical protein